MKTIEYSNRKDKAEWADGPWQHEPDKRQWQDEETGLPCLIVRGPYGAWCGYVGISEGHPLFKKDYSGLYDIDVHGGLTFSNGCQHSDDEGYGVCHLPDEGEPDNVWWLGFDCSHASDLSPGMEALRRKHFPEHLNTELPEEYRDVYRDIDYVTAEVRSLAKQLKAMEE